MQKSLRKILVILSILCFLSASFSAVTCFAQDEEEGFIKRMWRKVIRAKQTEEGAKTPEGVIPEEKEPPAASGDEKVKIPPALKKDFMLDVMRNNLDAYGSELSAKIPDIVTEPLPGDKAAYKFKKATGEIVDFENLSDEELFKVFRKLINEANMIRTERMNIQLQQIRQSQQQIQQIHLPQQVVRPPTPPQVPRPQNIPPPPPRPPQHRK